KFGVILFPADDQHKQDVTKKGATQITVKGNLRNWSEVDKVSLDQYGKPRKVRAVLNFERNLPLVQKDTMPDPVIQTTFTGRQEILGRTVAMPSPTKSYDGLNYASNGAGWPPDPNGDVGIDHYVQTVNTSIGIFNKSTGALISATTFDKFFGGTGIIGTPCDGDNNGDPIVLYDQYAQRWFILDFAWDPSGDDGSYFSIAASKTSNPTGEWWQYAFRADNTLMNDYPKCGIWQNGIYISANMFEFSGGYKYVKVWAIKKPDIYNGTLTAQYITDSGDYAYSLLPSNAKGSTAPSSTSPNYFYALDASEYGSGHSDAIYVWKYSVNWSNPAATTWTGPSSMTTAPFTIVSDDVTQKGTSMTLDSLYGRLMYSAMYRKFATYESVYLCHLAESNKNRAMRWYEIRINNGSSSIHQQGTYSPDTNHRWMGSIAADKSGNIAMGYSVSSSTLYPSIRYCGRLATDTPGIMGQGEASLIAGSGSQTSYNRWGDYSMLSIDPVDDETFWYTTEYFGATGTNWKTRFGSFKMTAAPPTGNDIGNAVDAPSQIFNKTGNANWARVTNVSFYDGDSAKSGTINHSQSSTIKTSINLTAAKDVKFYWKVSSEANYDFLTFYIDGVQKARISGNVNWTQKVFNLPAGSHALKWTYAKNASIKSGSDCGWVDKLEIVASTKDPIADAVDKSTLSFSLSGDKDWSVTTNDKYYGSSSVTVPTVLNDSESTSMLTSISGFNTIKFYWKVSSEANYDFLFFYIDDVEKAKISGNTSWAQKSFTVTPGEHTYKWVYVKDSSVSGGSDTGWVDKVELL
ncbi:MAG: hypothetical protein MUF15_13790, partial [Acidobacteria bacterium]|nr:hypothetical protein [Acidobacteriota bacterium]